MNNLITRIKCLARCCLYTSKRCITGSENPPFTTPCEPDLLDRGICAIDPCDPLSCYPEPRVVIIGAGMAGLSVADRLSQRGINNYVVLEAYERPGGRIHSRFLGDVVVEVGGALEMPYRSNHKVYDILAHENPSRPGVPAAAHPRGLFTRVLPGTAECRPIVSAYCKFRQIEKEAMSLFCLGGSKQHGSLINFISLRIQQELHEYPEDQQHEAARIMFGLAHILTARCGCDNAMLCSDHMGSYMYMQGGYARVPLGTIGVLSPLLKRIPEARIRYCKPVSNVYWGTALKQGHRALVVTADGEEFPCDYVVSTVSIGVLIKNCTTLFCPELPLSKMFSMQKIGIGLLDKIYLEYYRPFWFWHSGDINIKCCHGQICGAGDWTSGITSIEKVPYSNHVLCVRVTGQGASTMEGLSDKEVATGVTNVLRQCTGNNSIPYPMTVLKSKWAADPFFLGSYTFESETTCGKAQLGLACPIPGPGEPSPPILLFAGEATVPNYFGTLAGARLSGVREAERIVQLTLQFEGPPHRYGSRAEADYEAKKHEVQN